MGWSDITSGEPIRGRLIRNRELLASLVPECDDYNALGNRVDAMLRLHVGDPNYDQEQIDAAITNAVRAMQAEAFAFLASPSEGA